jgi:hypothetical protein
MARPCLSSGGQSARLLPQTGSCGIRGGQIGAGPVSPANVHSTRASSSPGSRRWYSRPVSGRYTEVVQALHPPPKKNFRKYFCSLNNDSSVGIATGYVVVGRGIAVRVPVETDICSPLIFVRTGSWGPPDFLLHRSRGSLWEGGLKLQGREADHPPQTSAHTSSWHNWLVS